MVQRVINKGEYRMIIFIIIGVCLGVLVGYNVGKDAGRSEFERKIVQEVLNSNQYSEEVFEAFKKSINKVRVK